MLILYLQFQVIGGKDYWFNVFAAFIENLKPQPHTLKNISSHFYEDELLKKYLVIDMK